MKTLLITALLALSCGAASAQNNSKQATDAAAKHRSEQPKSTPNARAAAKPSQGGSVAQRLAACKNNAEYNLIKREQCVWNMCKGRWGRDGCPAEGGNKVDR